MSELFQPVLHSTCLSNPVIDLCQFRHVNRAISKIILNTIRIDQGTGDRIPPQLQLQVAQATKLFFHMGLVLDEENDNDMFEDWDASHQYSGMLFCYQFFDAVGCMHKMQRGFIHRQVIVKKGKQDCEV